MGSGCSVSTPATFLPLRRRPRRTWRGAEGKGAPIAEETGTGTSLAQGPGAKLRRGQEDFYVFRASRQLLLLLVFSLLGCFKPPADMMGTGGGQGGGGA